MEAAQAVNYVIIFLSSYGSNALRWSRMAFRIAMAAVKIWMTKHIFICRRGQSCYIYQRHLLGGKIPLLNSPSCDN